MSRYLSKRETEEWLGAVCAALDRLVANGLTPNEAFASLPDGLPGESRDLLRLYWEVSRATPFGESVKAASFAATYREGGAA